MKKAGVPVTPRRIASSTLFCTAAAWVPLARQRSKLERSSPTCRAYALELLGAGPGRVGEERVVILPELPLVVGAPRRLGCVPSLGMEAVHRKVPVHELHFLAVAGQDLSQRRDDPLAERTVKVRERDDRHRRRGWSPERSSLDPNLGLERRGFLKTDHHGGLRA